MSDKPIARELLKEARNWIESLCDVYSDEIGKEMTHKGYALKNKLDAYLSAPDEDAIIGEKGESDE